LLTRRWSYQQVVIPARLLIQTDEQVRIACPALLTQLRQALADGWEIYGAERWPRPLFGEDPKRPQSRDTPPSSHSLLLVLRRRRSASGAAPATSAVPAPRQAARGDTVRPARTSPAGWELVRAGSSVLHLRLGNSGQTRCGRLTTAHVAFTGMLDGVEGLCPLCRDASLPADG